MNLGILIKKSHYYSYCYPCTRGGGKAVQAGLSWPPPPPRIWVSNFIRQFLLHHYLGICSCKRYRHHSVKLRCLFPPFSFLTFVQGVEASSPDWFILPSPPPPRLLGQSVSSVNSYCTIILEYVVVRDRDIISVKLRCLLPPFSLVTLVRGVRGQVVHAGLSCPTAQNLGQAVPSVNSFCTIALEYVV